MRLATGTTFVMKFAIPTQPTIHKITNSGISYDKGNTFRNTTKKIMNIIENIRCKCEYIKMNM